jgi:hypothetical protein
MDLGPYEIYHVIMITLKQAFTKRKVLTVLTDSGVNFLTKKRI